MDKPAKIAPNVTNTGIPEYEDCLPSYGGDPAYCDVSPSTFVNSENCPLDKDPLYTLKGDVKFDYYQPVISMFCPKCKSHQPVQSWGESYACLTCGTHIFFPPVEKPVSGYSKRNFEDLFEEFTEAEKHILGLKENEYASNDDRLENFHTQAIIQGVEPMDVALTYMLKHVLAISNAVRERAFDWSWQTDVGTEGIKQRFADMRNYAMLLAACIDEYVRKRGVL